MPRGREVTPEEAEKLVPGHGLGDLLPGAQSGGSYEIPEGGKYPNGRKSD